MKLLALISVLLRDDNDCRFNCLFQFDICLLLIPHLPRHLIEVLVIAASTPSYPASSFPLTSGQETARLVKPACAVTTERNTIVIQQHSAAFKMSYRTYCGIQVALNTLLCRITVTIQSNFVFISFAIIFMQGDVVEMVVFLFSN